MVLYGGFIVYHAVCLSPILNNAEHSQLIAVSNTQLTASILLGCSSSPTQTGNWRTELGSNPHLSAPI
jgi:hypothetical protein